MVGPGRQRRKLKGCFGGELRVRSLRTKRTGKLEFDYGYD